MLSLRAASVSAAFAAGIGDVLAGAEEAEVEGAGVAVVAVGVVLAGRAPVAGAEVVNYLTQIVLVHDAVPVDIPDAG